MMLLALAVLLVAACGSESSQSTDPSSGFVPPDEPGPYAVGNTSYLMVDPSRYDRSTNSDRQLLVEVWYPAGPGPTTPEQGKLIDFIHEPWTHLVVSVFSLLLPPEELGNLYKSSGSIPQAPVARSSRPFPLILFSHGNGGIRFQNYTLACYLASHGFIFAAPDHTENAAFAALPDNLVIFNPLLIGKDLADRPKDIEFILETLLALNEPGSGDMLEGAIDPERIGVAGHSLGGLTVMTEVLTNERIKAGLNMAGPWLGIAVSDLHVPMMYMIGLEDRTVGVPYNPLIVDTYEHSPDPKFLLEFPDGGHFTFTDACGIAPSLFGNGDGCGEGTRYNDGSPFQFIDPELAQTIEHAYISAFFSLALNGDERYRPYLSANHFPGSIDFTFEFGGLSGN